jgi:hypothetical protein
MIKLHLFRGFENQRLGIQRDTLLGHLYSDRDNDELIQAALSLGIDPKFIQNSRGFYHFDLWGEHLTKARNMFMVVTNHEIYADMLKVGERRKTFG